MTTVRAAAERAGLEYHLYTSLQPEVKPWGTGANVADLFRFHHFAANPDDIYLDADIVIHDGCKLFAPPPNGKPYFGTIPMVHKSGGIVPTKAWADVFTIHGNGASDFWKKMLKYLLSFPPGEMWSFHVCRKLNYMSRFGTWQPIPAGYYEHRCFGTWRNRHV